MKSRVNVDIYMNAGQDSEMSNTVHMVKHYEVRQDEYLSFVVQMSKIRPFMYRSSNHALCSTITSSSDVQGSRHNS